MLRVHPDEPEPDLVKYIVSCLRAGSVVGMPTDTFYGLSVDPVNLRAVESIYEIKSRLKHKPLSLLIADVDQAYELARDLGDSFDALTERFWPGPLTLIVRAGAKLCVNEAMIGRHGEVELLLSWTEQHHIPRLQLGLRDAPEMGVELLDTPAGTDWRIADAD